MFLFLQRTKYKRERAILKLFHHILYVNMNDKRTRHPTKYLSIHARTHVANSV